jgi:4-hydroxy-2-oxovalerate aldolase
MKSIRIIDATLRDGMHAVSHRFTPDQMAAVAAVLDAAGVGTLEVGHGDGLGGSSYQYGFAAASDREYLTAAGKAMKKAGLDVLLIPGIGTIEHLKEAIECGVRTVRVATHVTEADVGEQHIRFAKNNGLEAVGFLMMAHMSPPAKVAEQAKLFAGYGADMIYVTDSAGAMVPDEVKARIGAVRDAVGLPVGFHAHNNLGLAIGNTLAAIDAGATCVDACLRGLGAAAGNAQLEVLVAVLKRLGYETGIDLYKVMDAGEILDPMMHRPQVIANDALAIGYAGAYGSFLLHARRAAEKFGVDARDILIEMGRRKTVGGQEDLIIEVAIDLVNARKG